MSDHQTRRLTAISSALHEGKDLVAAIAAGDAVAAENPPKAQRQTFTRVCVVDGTEVRDRYNVEATMEIQDDGKTLKVFIKPRTDRLVRLAPHHARTDANGVTVIPHGQPQPPSEVVLMDADPEGHSTYYLEVLKITGTDITARVIRQDSGWSPASDTDICLDVWVKVAGG